MLLQSDNGLINQESGCWKCTLGNSLINLQQRILRKPVLYTYHKFQEDGNILFFTRYLGNQRNLIKGVTSPRTERFIAVEQKQVMCGHDKVKKTRKCLSNIYWMAGMLSNSKTRNCPCNQPIILLSYEASFEFINAKHIHC